MLKESDPGIWYLAKFSFQAFKNEIQPIKWEIKMKKQGIEYPALKELMVSKEPFTKKTMVTKWTINVTKHKLT